MKTYHSYIVFIMPIVYCPFEFRDMVLFDFSIIVILTQDEGRKYKVGGLMADSEKENIAILVL